jgi:hypothetical protein
MAFDGKHFIYSLQPNQNQNLDFVGVKIGDVNNSAQAHLTQILPRNARLLLEVKAITNGELREGQINRMQIHHSTITRWFPMDIRNQWPGLFGNQEYFDSY